MKNFRKRLVLYIIMMVCVTVTFNLGIFGNPDFRVGDFFMNLSSEFVGLVFAVCIVEVYTREKLKARGEKKEPEPPPVPAQAVVKAVIFDCDEPEALAGFYAQLLGGDVQGDPYGGWVLRVPGLELGFQSDEHYRRPVFLGEQGDQQPMVHLDLRVPELAKAVEFALSIGATEPREQFCQPEWDVQWVTLLDPAGHPFCLFDRD